MSKIIVAPPVPGEFAPLLQVARGLAVRGHQVTVPAGSDFRPAVERAVSSVPQAGILPAPTAQDWQPSAWWASLMGPARSW